MFGYTLTSGQSAPGNGKRFRPNRRADAPHLRLRERLACSIHRLFRKRRRQGDDQEQGPKNDWSCRIPLLQDQADIEQELSLSLLKGLSRFDPARGSDRQFVSKVLTYARANILRDRSAKKRNAGEVIPLSRAVSRVNQFISTSPDVLEDECCKWFRRSTFSDEEHCNLKLDVETIMAKLPLETRRLAELLKHHSVTEVARLLDMPRTTLISKLGPDGPFFELNRVFAYRSGSE